MRLLKQRNFSLLLGAFSILLLALLAASLDSLEFKQGEPFAYTKAVEEGVGPPGIPDIGWLYIIVVSFYIVLMIVILYYSPKDKRNKLIRALILFALVILGSMWLMTRGNKKAEETEPVPTTLHTAIPMSQEAPPQEEQVVPVDYIPPPISPWISIGITFGALLVAAIMIWFFLKKNSAVKVPLEALAGIAEKAVDDLHSGKEYGDAVINCYAGMMEVLNRRRSIFRRGDLTPTEFISVLERTSLPSASVRRLTALFEKARYGGKNTSQLEVDEAISCLKEIIGAIRD